MNIFKNVLIFLLVIKSLTTSVAQTYKNDSLTVINLLKLNGVYSMNICSGDDDILLPDSLCHQPICVDSLVTTRNNRIITLHFSNQFSSGSRKPAILGSEIVHITELESLYLEADYLDSLPDELSQLKSLKFLQLSGNKFTRFPEVICSISELEFLDIGGAFFKSLPPSISMLTNLKTLRLGGNEKITSLPQQISDMKKLEVLQLISSPIFTLPSEICNLTNMTSLTLIYCKLTSLPDAIENLTSLQHLDLSFNNLTSLPESFGNLKNLRSLFLDNNQLETLPSSILNITNNEFSCFITGNRICNPSDSIGSWIDSHSAVGLFWRKTQKDCPAILYHSNLMFKSNVQGSSFPTEIYTLQGSKVNAPFRSNVFKKTCLPKGIYISKEESGQRPTFKKIIIEK